MSGTMRTTVVIRKRGDLYIADVQGMFGGGYQGATAGREPHDAATFASREMIRYGTCNDRGASLVAPQEVTDLVPEHLRDIAAK